MASLLRIRIKRKDGVVQTYYVSRESLKKYRRSTKKKSLRILTPHTTKKKKSLRILTRPQRELRVLKEHDILARYRHGKKKNQLKEEITTARPVPGWTGQVHIVVYYNHARHEGYSLLGDCYAHEQKYTDQALNHTGTDVESSFIAIPDDYRVISKEFVYYRHTTNKDREYT